MSLLLHLRTYHFILRRDSIMQGAVSLKGNAWIDGILDGDLIVRGRLVIGDHGCVKGNVHAEYCILDGMIDGNLIVQNIAQINNKASITGNLTAKTIHIKSGSIVKGKMIKETDFDIIEQKDAALVAKKERLLKTAEEKIIISKPEIFDSKKYSVDKQKEEKTENWF